MKKAIFIGVIMMISLSSCVKTRVCVCNDTSGGSTTYTIPLKTKKNAKTICTGYQDSYYTSCNLN